MEDVASDYFGRQISNFRFEELARDADQTLRLLHLATPATFAEDAANSREEPDVLRDVSAEGREISIFAE